MIRSVKLLRDLIDEVFGGADPVVRTKFAQNPAPRASTMLASASCSEHPEDDRWHDRECSPTESLQQEYHQDEGRDNMADQRYLKALRFDVLTPLYDFVIRHALPEAEFKRHLVRQADIRDGQRVLDLGCGTATLSVLMKELHPAATIIGLDGDPKILGLAKKKALHTASDILLTLGMAYELPYADGSFDRVLSSLVLHHLSREQKRRTLRELYRVLRSGGWLHIADWGEARSVRQRIGAWMEQLFDGYDNTSDNFLGRLPELFAEAGFQYVQEVCQYQTLVTGLSLFQASKV